MNEEQSDFNFAKSYVLEGNIWGGGGNKPIFR